MENQTTHPNNKAFNELYNGYIPGVKEAIVSSYQAKLIPIPASITKEEQIAFHYFLTGSQPLASQIGKTKSIKCHFLPYPCRTGELKTYGICPLTYEQLTNTDKGSTPKVGSKAARLAQEALDREIMDREWAEYLLAHPEEEPLIKKNKSKK